MPAVTLVVCVYRQHDLLERLLRESVGCYDELLVLHDVPDVQNTRSVVEAAGGRFFETPSVPHHEPHFPFAWQQATHDWILRLDADEFPGNELKAWLQKFRQAPEPAEDVSAFMCSWPLWDGQRTVSKKWPDNHVFLFHRNRVRFFGLCEQGVIPDGRYEKLDLVLHHQPRRKSYDLGNILVRRQAYVWRAALARELLGKPTDLPCWRWQSETWPLEWQQIRQHPFQTALCRLVMQTFRGLRSQWRVEKRFFPQAALSGPVHHALICLKFWQLRRQRVKKTTPDKAP